MSENLVFSYAEDADGQLVHVDTVPNGNKCGCFCPYCHAPLIARHGENNTHGFAHNDKERKSELKICYMVSLYKRAEQIIQEKKKIHAPSYYGIFPENDIEFVDVKIDSRYERDDKQPDVIATTADGKNYLIVFVFDYRPLHLQPIDYEELNCLEINLSFQPFESLEKFLLEDNSKRRWLNNPDYFNIIEPTYKQHNKIVKVKEEDDCNSCKLKYWCCGVKPKNSRFPLIIENNGQKYRICKTEQYHAKVEEIHHEQEERKECKKQELSLIEREDKRQHRASIVSEQRVANQESYHNTTPVDPTERICFNCSNNLAWGNKDGFAYCGCHQRACVPQRTSPNSAKDCKLFSNLHHSNNTKQG